MSLYSAFAREITPSTTDDNWIVEAQTAEVGFITNIWWGGNVTTSTNATTRTTRGSGQAGAGTAGNIAKHGNDQTALLAFFTTYATTQPTLNAGDLVALSWNMHGGVVRIALSIEEAFQLIGKATPDELSTICNRNATGVSSSTYGVTWKE